MLQGEEDLTQGVRLTGNGQVRREMCAAQQSTLFLSRRNGSLAMLRGGVSAVSVVRVD